MRGTDNAGGANQVFRLTDLKKAEAVLTLLEVSRLWHLTMVPGEKNLLSPLEKKR